MIRVLLIAFLLIGFSACKSIKKAKEKQVDKEIREATKMMVDSTSYLLNEAVKKVENEENTEVIEQTFVAIDSAGVTVIKPVTVTRRNAKSNRVYQESKEEKKKDLTLSQSSQVEESKSRSKDLDKSSESEQIIGQVTDALFPSWAKILMSILGVVGPVAFGIWKKRNQS
jgi:hypothetical protein